jgi:hypothetical protein
MNPINFIIFFIYDNANFVKVVSEHLEEKAIDALKADYTGAEITKVIMEGEQPEPVEQNVIVAKRTALINTFQEAICFKENIVLKFEQIDNFFGPDTENHEIEEYTVEIMESRQGAYKAANIIESWERVQTRKATPEVTRDELIHTLTEAINLQHNTGLSVKLVSNWLGQDIEKIAIENHTKEVMEQPLNAVHPDDILYHSRRIQ